MATIDEIRPSRKGCKGMVTGSWGVYDIYKAIRKQGWYNIGSPVSEKDFYAIIRSVNKILADHLANGEPITLPHRMGVIELRKVPTGVGIVDGKLKITYPIDWGSTLELWSKDEEAKKEKALVRYENGMLYHFKYYKKHACYNNKKYYGFIVNKFIKRALKENIKSGKTDTLW